MRNVRFKDKETKEFYQSLVKRHPGLPYVLLNVFGDNDILVSDIAGDIYNLDIVLMINDQKIDIIIDLLKNKIILVTPENEYNEIYDNYSKKDIKPVGYQYINKNRIVIKNNYNSIDSEKKIYYYDIIDGNNYYNILIEDDYNTFKEKDFINKILHSRTKYSNLCCLLLMILKNFKLSSVTVKITDTKRGIAIINKGLLTSYTEYRVADNEYQKIYLDHNEIMIEKNIKEVYQNDLNSYIKKIGECDGKEKR